MTGAHPAGVVFPRAAAPDAASRRSLGLLLRWPLATLLATTIPGAVLVLGAVMEIVRGSVERRWRRLGAAERERAAPRPRDGAAGSGRPAPGRGPGRLRAVAGSGPASRGAGSFATRWGATALLGVQGLAASWLVTSPALVLWAFAWHAGWNTSFQKVYEQAAVGPLLGLLGCVLFCLVLPPAIVAHARHALTGDWRTGVDLPFAWRLCLRRPVGTVLVAGLHLGAALLLGVATILPTFLGTQPFFEALDDGEALAFLRRFLLVVTAGGLALFLAVRLAAARLYAEALHRLVVDGTLPATRLHPQERRHLAPAAAAVGVPVATGAPGRRPRAPFPVGLRGARTVAGFVGLALAGVLWFGVVVQVFVGAFAHDRGPRQWLHQPLLHAPWWHAVPEGLESAGDPAPEPHSLAGPP